MFNIFFPLWVKDNLIVVFLVCLFNNSYCAKVGVKFPPLYDLPSTDGSSFSPTNNRSSCVKFPSISNLPRSPSFPPTYKRLKRTHYLNNFIFIIISCFPENPNISNKTKIRIKKFLTARKQGDILLIIRCALEKLDSNLSDMQAREEAWAYINLLLCSIKCITQEHFFQLLSSILADQGVGFDNPKDGIKFLNECDEILAILTPMLLILDGPHIS